MNEDKLIQECKDLYDHMVIIYKNTEINSLDDCKALIKKLSQFQTEKVHFVSKSDINQYIQYEVHVDKYVILRGIFLESYQSDIMNLIEDLTMSYYRNHNGSNIPNTMELMKIVR